MAGEIQLNSVTLATESGGVASIDSSVDIKGPLNASGSAPIYACRAWVNFNGTGTVATRASGNVSSITDNGGSGSYTVNMTNALVDTNYAISLTSGTSASGQGFIAYQDYRTTATTTSAFRLTTATTSANTDVDSVFVIVFR